jgi:hypothetical protein
MANLVEGVENHSHKVRTAFSNADLADYKPNTLASRVFYNRRNTSTDGHVFEQVALNGPVADKDAVQLAVKQLPNLYSQVGVPKRDAQKKAREVGDKFDGATMNEQVKIGQQIINAVGALASAIGIGRATSRGR